MNNSNSSFISGVNGGIALVLVAHPFDLLKVRMQSSQLTMSQTFKYAISQGISGLYRGVSPVLIGAPLIMGLNLFSYSKAQEIFYTGSVLSISELGYSGAIGGIPVSLIVAPAEQIKIQLQTSNQSMSKAFISSFRNESRLMIRNGIFLTLLRDIPGGFFYFSTYEYVKRSFPSFGSWFIPIAGGIAGSFTWLVTMPFDTIKTKVQSSSGPAQDSISKIISKTFQQNGFRGFYKGLAPTLLRAFPASAAFFGGVEITGHLLSSQ